LPIDEGGARVDLLPKLALRHRLRAVYLTPHHQFPTTVALAASRRMALLDFARDARLAVIEDDYDHEFHYEGRPMVPLASLDRGGVVIYVGTLSKVLAPGLRLGYVVGPPELIDCLAAFRVIADTQGDQCLEAAVAEMFEDGEVQRHVNRMRRVYLARRNALADALRSVVGDALTFQPPRGGMAIWARVSPGLDVEAWAAHAAEHGVVAPTARAYALDGRSRPFFRLGFAGLTPEELNEAARRLGAALGDLRAGGGPGFEPPAR
jgi:GntR family transcriptional regulator/MocR family aminotransferase